jgi:uncharacterized membrane-anchored protein YitT (DUF2179 family)
MMMNKLTTIIMTFLIAFSLSLLIIPGIAILGGVTGKYIIKPIYEKITDPGPLYVDDTRCCR